MKSICKLIVVALLFAMIFAVTELKAQDSQDSKIGLTVGIDYVSNFLYRGLYYYDNSSSNNTGMIAPYVSYDIFETGLSVSIKGEIIEMWFWDERDEYRDTVNFKVMNSMSYNANYKYEVKEIIKFNIGGWYYAYQTVYAGSNINRSYFDVYLSAQIDALPLAPILIVTYSYFIDEDYARGVGSGGWGTGDGKNGDLYVQFGLGHSFEFFYKTYFDLEAIAGFYDRNSAGVHSIAKDSTQSPDISDIDLSAGFTIIAGVLTLSSSFHYVIVPGTQYKYVSLNPIAKDIHRFYTKFGVSCSI